jgi:hypothetical protein
LAIDLSRLPQIRDEVLHVGRFDVANEVRAEEGSQGLQTPLDRVACLQTSWLHMAFYVEIRQFVKREKRVTAILFR